MADMGNVTRKAKVPLIVVLGATGTGKSKLAIEIASKFNGEIISADSMQVYEGLDVITNKVTVAEQGMVPHHFLNIISPLSQYSVTDFQSAALPVLERLLNICGEKPTIPVVVGGTNYYIESLLWNVLVPVKRTDKILVFDHDKALHGTKSNMLSSHETCSSKVKDSKSSVGHFPKTKKRKSSEDDGILTSETSISTVERQNCGDMNGGSEILFQGSNDFGGDGINKATNDFGGDGIHKATNDFGGDGIHKATNDFGGDGINKATNDMGSSDDTIIESENFANEDLLEVWQHTDVPTDLILQRLMEVDPEIASQYHPNDRRKIIRSLQVWHQTGRRHSEILKEQRLQGGSYLGGSLRYPNTVILWITCQQEVLDVRLDKRVDQMLQDGLLNELLSFHAAYNRQRLKETSAGGNTTEVTADYTKGIFQSIGFKEFHEYLILPDEERESEMGMKLYQQGVENLKLMPQVYAFDGTNLPDWHANVSYPALKLVSSLLEGRIPDLNPMTVEKNGINRQNETPGDKSRYHCATCDRVFIGTHQWQQHITGAKHRKMLQKKIVTTKNISELT